MLRYSLLFGSLEFLKDMPHSLSAAKRLRQTKKRTSRNRMWKGRVKELVKESKKLIAIKDAKSPDTVKKALATVDRAVAKGVLHRNTGARLKSRLMKRLNSINKS